MSVEEGFAGTVDVVGDDGLGREAALRQGAGEALAARLTGEVGEALVTSLGDELVRGGAREMGAIDAVNAAPGNCRGIQFGTIVLDESVAPAGTRTDLATQWLRLTTTSTSPTRHHRAAAGISGRSLR